MSKINISGFTLVETLVSMVLLSILVVGLLSTFFVLTANKHNERYFAAVKTAEYTIDSLAVHHADRSFSRTDHGFTIDGIITKTGTGTIISVSVTWGSNKKLNHVSLTRTVYQQNKQVTYYSEAKY